MKIKPIKIIFSISLILSLVGCAEKYVNKVNINDNQPKNINTLKKECYKHNLDSCYKAGNYYRNKIDTDTSAIDSALIYYDYGCMQVYNAGLIIRDIKVIKNKRSCLEQAKILKLKKKLIPDDAILAHARLKEAAEHYYKKNDFMQAREYYVEALKWFTDEEIYYKLSQIVLIEEGNKIDYKLSEQYYLHYFKYAVQLGKVEYKKLKRLAKTRLNTSSLTVEAKITVLENGTISNVLLIKPSKDNEINQIIIRQIKNKTFYPIPPVYSFNSNPVTIKYLIE